MHICVVGDGAAGLMAANLFAVKDYVSKVTLVGSSKIPSIGVGESTTLIFENLHRALITMNFLKIFTNKKKQDPITPKERTCSNCNETKPLDKDHFEVVKFFRSGLSYYCLECCKPKPRD